METTQKKVTVIESKNKITPEMAEMEFARFAEEMDLDVDREKMDHEDRKGFDEQKAKIVRAICAGILTINEAGEPVLSYMDKEGKKSSLTFHEPDGAAYLALDGKAKHADQRRQFEFMAAMTGTSAGTFGTMRNRYFKICQAIVVFFVA